MSDEERAALAEFGALLRALREEAGMTLRALASEVGCTHTYLNSLERVRQPSPAADDLLIRIEAAVGDTAETLQEARARWHAAHLPQRALKYAAQRYAASMQRRAS